MKYLCEKCGWAFENFGKEKLCQVCGSTKLHELTEEEEKLSLNGENNWNDCARRAKEIDNQLKQSYSK